MKALYCICCIFIIACLMIAAESEKAPSKIEQQLMDAFIIDDPVKMKRPFCNAFTGCGRKRSFHENSMNSQDTESRGSVRLPFSFYKALLSAASQNIRNTIDRDGNGYQLTGIPQMYFFDKTPLQKRFDVAPTSLD